MANCNIRCEYNFLIFSRVVGDIMPQNLPKHVLPKIALLSTQGNSQRQIAGILGVSQRCFSKVLKCNRQQGLSGQKKRGVREKMSTPGEDHHLLLLIRVNSFLSAPRLNGRDDSAFWQAYDNPDCCKRTSCC